MVYGIDWCSEAEPMKIERARVDVDATTKHIVDDLIERGYFRDQQTVLAAAVAALQLQMADETMSDEYYDEDGQQAMDALQLGARA
jgi:hypothetical protein